MQHLRILANIILLLTITPALIFPQNLPLIIKNSPTKHLLAKDFYSSTYDEILQLLDLIESDNLDIATEEDWERIDDFLIHLAQESIHPDDEESALVLEESIAQLLDDSFFEFASTTPEPYINAPSSPDDQAEIAFCKKKSKKSHGKSKSFVKKHKKEIIIGAAIIVGSATIIGIIIVTGGAAASSSPKQKKKDKPHSNAAPIAYNPILENTIREEKQAFKEFLAEDIILQSTDVNQDLSFKEKMRDLGSNFSHGLLDEISDLSRELVIDIPQVENNPFLNGSRETFEGLIAKGH